MRVAVLIFCAFSSFAANAMVQPKASKFDERVRAVQYNPDDVVEVDCKAGISTHIQLEEGEEYVIHSFGDADAWELAAEGSHYFIKPKGKQADTNLNIVTNLRSYHFRLNYHQDQKANEMYRVRFEYPDSKRKRSQALLAKKAIEKGFARDAKALNFKYTMGGDRDIAPVNVWDDGDFTYFKFPKERDLPGIYLVDVNGRESMANRTSKGASSNIVVVQKVNQRWMLRLGKRALGVYNESKWVNRTPNLTRTASPLVKRLLREK